LRKHLRSSVTSSSELFRNSLEKRGQGTTVVRMTEEINLRGRERGRD